MFSSKVLPLLCCPTDHAALEFRHATTPNVNPEQMAWSRVGGDALMCTQCATVYTIRDGYAELLPRAEYEHTTLYAEDEGGHILDYRDLGRPLLSAQVKNNLLNEFLRFEKNDVVLDLGCGNGKFAYWNRDKVATMLAADLAPWFADRARAELPLLRADLRALPVRAATLDKVFSIDVLEHLTRDDIARVLDETRRVLKPGGRFFVFSNTREKQTLAPLMAPQQAVTRWLSKRGAVDFTRDDWRKSDHVKAIRTYEELRAMFEGHGFVVKRVAFWNGVLQGWIENVFMKLGENYLSQKARGENKLEQQVRARSNVRAAMQTTRGGKYIVPLEIASKVMQLDITLFGNLRAGPYFVLVEKQ
ncbi:MAG: class I SAM-dependent methyltransferase [Chloroflexi bacterium]|nr:class I SAM-dependent methyltransferase [Chloroflexota bacterium]